MKRLLLIIFLIFNLLFISGCTKSIQLYEKLLVEGVGVDYKNSEYVLTLQIINSNESSSSDKSSTPKQVKIVSAKGSTIKEASTNIIKQTGKEPLYSQALILVLGKSATELGLNKFMDFFIHNNEFSPDTRVLISNNDARDILNVKENEKESKEEELVPAEDILNMLEEGSNRSQKLNSTIEKIIGDLKSKYSDVKIALVDLKKENNKSQLMVNKIGIFKDDKFKYCLNENETKGALILRAKADKTVDTVISRDFPKVTYTISKIKAKTKVNIENSKPIINIDEDISVNINESETEISINDFSKLEKIISNHINTLSYKAIDASLIKNECDIFDFSKMLTKINAGYNLKSKAEMLDSLKGAIYNVSTKVKVSTIY